MSIQSRRLECHACGDPVEHVLALVHDDGTPAPGFAYACEVHVQEIARSLGKGLFENVPGSHVEYNETPPPPRKLGPPPTSAGEHVACVRLGVH